jgi:serine phosphatase RsbU (regulator of sigma subunit)
MTRGCKSVHELIREMNTKLSSLLPVGNFVAVTLISMDRGKRQLEIWNGGNPPILLADKSGRVTHKFKSRHMALGVMRGDDFDAGTESFSWSDAGSLVLFSDGLVDATNATGAEFGEEGIVSALQCGSSHQYLKVAIAAHLGGQGANDDISLATVILT